MNGRLLSTHQVLSVRDGAQQVQWTQVYCVIPSRTECPDCDGPDEMFGGSNDVTCATCGGTGWIVVAQTSTFLARTRWRADIVADNPYFRTDVMSADMGDVAVVFRADDRQGVELLLANELVYFIVDGKRARPKTHNMSTLFGDISFVVFCNLEGQDRD